MPVLDPINIVNTAAFSSMMTAEEWFLGGDNFVPWNVWQSLETFLVVTILLEEGLLLASGAQNPPTMNMIVSKQQQQNYLATNNNSVKVENFALDSSA